MGCVCPFPDLEGNNDYVLTEAEKRKYPDSKCGVIWPFCIYFKKGSMHVTFSQGVIKNDDEVE